MDVLTERLTAEGTAVELGGPEPSAADLRRRVEDLGYVLVRFPGTAGGTELGFTLDRTATDVSGADFGAARGTAHLEGTLFLNGDPVRCVADLDVATLAGVGRLVPVDAAAVVVD